MIFILLTSPACSRQWSHWYALLDFNSMHEAYVEQLYCLVMLTVSTRTVPGYGVTKYPDASYGHLAPLTAWGVEPTQLLSISTLPIKLFRLMGRSCKQASQIISSHLSLVDNDMIIASGIGNAVHLVSDRATFSPVQMPNEESRTVASVDEVPST